MIEFGSTFEIAQITLSQAKSHGSETLTNALFGQLTFG
jgi:hypothetical protein